MTPVREPRSLGGDLNVSRRCWGNEHDLCRGSWTAYPDESGPCECECHKELEVTS